MNERKNVVLISASPKVGEPSVSAALVKMAEQRMDPTVIHLDKFDVRQCLASHSEAEAYAAMAQAEGILITFPLYFFCLPGILIRFLQDYAAELPKLEKTDAKQKIYCAVNCGFPEAGICDEAVKVIQSFSRQVGAEFRFGMMLGGGGMFLGAKDAPFMKRAMNALHAGWDEMRNDILSGNSDCKNYRINANIPRRVYFFMGGKGFEWTARKNGLTKKDLLRRPYRGDSPAPAASRPQK